MNRNLTALATIAGMILLGAASQAPAAQPQWGDTVSGSVSLESDLIRPVGATGPALIAGGDLEVNLCGWKIDGRASDGSIGGSGIESSGFDLDVHDGTITNTAGPAVSISAVGGAVIAGVTPSLNTVRIVNCGEGDFAAVRVTGAVQEMSFYSVEITGCKQGAILFAADPGDSSAMPSSPRLEYMDVHGNGNGGPENSAGEVSSLYRGTVTFCPAISPIVAASRFAANAEPESPSAPAGGHEQYLGFPALYVCSPSTYLDISGSELLDNPYGGVVLEAGIDIAQIYSNDLSGNGCDNGPGFVIGVDAAQVPGIYGGNYWGSPSGPNLHACDPDPTHSSYSSCGILDGDPGGFNDIPYDYPDPLLDIQGCGPVIPPTIPVTVDLEPGNSRNCINTGSKMLVKIAILGSATFDVAQVEPSSIMVFGVTPNPTLSKYEDVNLDGFMDLKLFLRGREIVPDCGSSVMTLTGLTMDDVPIEGSDHVCWLGPACP